MSEERVIVLPEQFDYEYSKQLLDDYPNVFATATSRIVALDFSRVQYIDSSALGMVVLLHKKAQEAGLKLSIRGAQNDAAEILRMANIQKIIDIE
jgi:anti-anti-sigma factor